MGLNEAVNLIPRNAVPQLRRHLLPVLDTNGRYPWKANHHFPMKTNPTLREKSGFICKVVFPKHSKKYRKRKY